MKSFLLSVVAVTFLCGCEGFDAAMVTMSDELSFADGYYYPDEHHSEPLVGDCAGVWDYGRVNNQSYVRVRNTSSYDATVTITWSAGAASELYLQPGETSDFEYRSGSIIPSEVSVSC